MAGFRAHGVALALLSLGGCRQETGDHATGRPLAHVELSPPDAARAAPLAGQVRSSAVARLQIQLDAIETDRGTIVSVPGDVAFDKAASEIRPDATDRLDALAALIVARKPPWVAIEGHTDNKGSAAYNHRLSLRRAASVRDYMVAVGGLDRRLLRVAGLGQRGAIASNDTERGRARNRRVEVILGH